MRWQSISDIIGPLRERDIQLSGNLRHDAALLATRAYGPRLLELPALVNFAALAISMRERLVVHRLARGATRAVAETDLHSLPGEPPKLLRGPWILESRNPEEPLFGSTSALAGYPLEGSIFLLGLDYPDGAYVAKWAPHWQERDLSAGLVDEDSPLIADVDRHREWARQAARFAVVLSLLLEADGSPVAVSEERRHPVRAGRGSRESEWTIRRVHLGRITRAVSRPPKSQAVSAPTPERQAVSVPVRGHVKRQPYGPGHTLRRWIYVESYEARRWVSPKPLRVDVLGP